MLCSPPFLGAEKGMTPTTICVSPPPLINNRSLNTPHQHFEVVLWKIVKPRLVRIMFIWGVMLLLVVFYLQKLWNFNFSRSIMQTEYMAQLSRFVYMNAIGFKCIFSQYDQKSVSRLFIVILLHSVVEYSLNQFPCHRQDRKSVV